jgi:hypothetical protein
MSASVRRFNLEGVFDKGQARRDFVSKGLNFGLYVVCTGPNVVTLRLIVLTRSRDVRMRSVCLCIAAPSTSAPFARVSALLAYLDEAIKADVLKSDLSKDELRKSSDRSQLLGESRPSGQGLNRSGPRSLA